MELPKYIAIYNYLKTKTFPKDCDDKEIKEKIKRLSRKYQAYDGRLFVGGNENDPGTEVLHSGNAQEVITRIHEEGHFGINNTWRRVRLQYEGYQLYEMVRNLVKSCDACQYRSKRGKIKKEEAHPIPTPSRPFFMIGCDAVGPMNETKNGNKYLLVAVDYLTRWPVVAAVPNINETTTGHFLFECVVKDFGVPNFILTDRGSNFLSRYVKTFLKRIGCRHLATTAHRPRTNGLCERMNQSIIQSLSKIARDKNCRDNWDECLSDCILAIRTMPHEVTKLTPAYLLYGYNMRTPMTWPAPRVDFVEGDVQAAIDERIKVIQTIVEKEREEAKLVSNKKKIKWKAKYDAGVDLKRFEQGDLVLMLDSYKENKLDDTWIGPFKITKVNQNGTYWLTGNDSKRIDGAVHGERLRPYYAKKKMVPTVLPARVGRNLEMYRSRSVV
jgi:hypothetical protein